MKSKKERQFERHETSECITYGRGQCKCGQFFSGLYYIWIKESEKICSLCYGTMEGVKGLPPMDAWEPETSIKLHIQSRLALNGAMPKCKKCVHKCKVPLTPNVTVFFCADFSKKG